MGKQNSFLFNKMHQFKPTLYSNEDDIFTQILLLMPKTCEHFALIHPDFSQKNAVLAMSGLFSLDGDERRGKYSREMSMYEDNPRGLIVDILNTGQEIIDIYESDAPNERSGIYICAFCMGMLKDGEDGEDYREYACNMLDRVLGFEESGTDVKDDVAIWSTLACFVDFESWHDNVYGSPIVEDTIPQNQNVNQTKKSSGGCYIATAVYGSYDCPEVWTFRRFRDDYLASRFFGRLFIRTYYAVSPTLVKLFGGTRLFNRFWKGKLDRIADDLKNKGYDDTPYYDR